MKKKDLISISELRVNLFRVFELFKNGGHINVTYRRKIYLFTIEPTDEKVTTPYRKSKTNYQNKIPPQSITSDQCGECGDLTLNGVCMSGKHN